jgi:hypothetical protein
MKPGAERCVGFVKYGISCRRYMVTAELARVNLAIGYPIMSSNLLALLAIYTLWPASIFKKIQASIIIGELFTKVFYSVGFHLLTPISLYTYIIPRNLRDVKGYLP